MSKADTITISWSEKDQAYIATHSHHTSLSVFGDTPSAAAIEIQEALRQLEQEEVTKDQSSICFDYLSILYCFREGETLFYNRWRPTRTHHESIVSLYERAKGRLNFAEGLKFEVSDDADTLNNFLESEGLEKVFSPFGPNEFGFSSNFKCNIRWKETLPRTEIISETGKYEAFIFPSGEDCRIREIDIETHLINLIGNKGYSLYLLTNPGPIRDIQDLKQAFDRARQLPLPAATNSYESVHIPETHIATTLDTSFLKGLEFGDHCLKDVSQHLSLSITQEGAVTKTQTSAKKLSMPKPVLRINTPFIGWLSMGDLADIPTAVFYSDHNCWRLL